MIQWMLAGACIGAGLWLLREGLALSVEQASTRYMMRRR